MARDFAGGTSTDKVKFGSSTPTTLRSVFIRAYADSYDAASVGPRYVDFSTDAGQVQDILFVVQSTAKLRIGIGWSTTEGAWETDQVAIGAWHSVGFVYDGGSTGNDPVLYISGVAKAVTEASTPAGSLRTTSAPTNIGNAAGLARPWNGRLAEYARWDALLTADEMAALAKGVSPLLVRAESLIAYAPLFGASSPEPDLISGLTGTVTGAAKGDHPPGLVYRHRRAPRGSAVSVPTLTRYRRPEGLASEMNGGTDRLFVWDNSLTVPRLKRAEVLAASSGTPTLPDMANGFSASGAAWLQVEGDDDVVRVVPAWPAT